MEEQRIVILELGGNRAAPVARTVRSLGVFSHISESDTFMDDVRAKSTRGVIVLGSPGDVNAPDALRLPPELFDCGIPVFAIGYGMYAMAYALMGRVEPSERKVPHKSRALLDVSCRLFNGMSENVTFENFFTDEVTILPRGFSVIGRTAEYPNAMMADESRKLYASQFFFDIASGLEVMKNFVFRICGCVPDRDAASLEETVINSLRAKAGKSGIVVGVSGGVSSLVCAAACMKAMSSACSYVTVNHGLFRENEIEEMIRHISVLGAELTVIDARERTLAELDGVESFREKRAIVRRIVFDEIRKYMKGIPGAKYIAMGITEIEMPELAAEFKEDIGNPKDLITPFSGMYRDEVRAIAKQYGFPLSMVSRHPFSSVGLAGRIHGPVTPERLDVERAADWIVLEEIMKTRCRTNKLMAVLFDPGKNEKEYCVVVRAVTMHGLYGPTFVPVPYRVLQRISERILASNPKITRVAYDISDVCGEYSESV